MATRLYVSNATAAPVSPTQDAGWDNIAGLTRRKLLDAKESPGGFATIADINTGAANSDTLLAQAVSDALTTGTVFALTDTCIGHMRSRESSVAANGFSQFIVRILDSTGTTVRATIRSMSGQTTVPGASAEWETVLTNARYPTDNATTGAGTAGVLTGAYTTVAGDIMVIEWGCRRNVATTSFTFSCEIGAPAATGDLPNDQTTATQLVPWVEFSNTFTFAGGAPPAATPRLLGTLGVGA